MNISGVKLTRQGDQVIVLIEVGGTWVPVISEHHDGCFDHIVNESGMRRCYQMHAAERWDNFVKEKQ